MANMGFNANQYDPVDDYTPLPAGKYQTIITESELTLTAKGGYLVKLTYTVQDGEFQGRKLWSNHNIFNNSPQAQEIGRREISRIAHAIGRPAASDTDEFTHAEVQVTVIVKNDNQYGPKNEIMVWKPAGNISPASYQSVPTETSRR